MPLSKTDIPPSTAGGNSPLMLARMIAGISAPVDATPVIDTATLRG